MADLLVDWFDCLIPQLIDRSIDCNTDLVALLIDRLVGWSD